MFKRLIDTDVYRTVVDGDTSCKGQVDCKELEAKNYLIDRIRL